MQTYRIIAVDDGTFAAEFTGEDGTVELASAFPTRLAALNWVGERLIVREDRHEPEDF